MSDQNLDVILAENLVDGIPLPANVKTGAIKAMNYLLGGVGLWANAWFRRWTQSVDDGTDAKSLMSRKLAEAASDLAVDDPEVVSAAMQAMLPSMVRKQANKEKVVAAAVEDLAGGETVADEGATAEISEDWLNAFERLAEDASSEEMQRYWGRVLAGELRQPGSFGRATLRFLNEVDQQTAEDFRALAPKMLRDVIIRDKNDDDVAVIVRLEAFGLVSGSGGMLSATLEFDERGLAFLYGVQKGLIAKGEPSSVASLPIYALTPLGTSVGRLTPNPDETATLKLASEMLKGTNVKGCSLAKRDGNSFDQFELLWGEAVQ